MPNNYLPKWQEEEFILKLPFKLTKSEKGYNLKCPICGDSKLKKYKKRGWILTDGQNLVYYCHNCSTSLSFKNFLKRTTPQLYQEYLDNLKKVFFSHQKIHLPKIETVRESNIPLNFSKLSSDVFEKIINSPKHLEYCRNRKIPENIIKTLYYIKSPEKLKNKILDSSFLIFPFYYKNTDYIYGFQGRSIDKKLFFIYVNEGFNKIYNQFNVNYNKPVFVLESIIDSFFVENSIAMLGSDLPKSFIEKYNKDNFIFIFDNDKTGKIKQEKYLRKGFKVLLYPKDFLYKDINEMFISENKFTFEINTCISFGKIGLIKKTLQCRRSQNGNSCFF